ncbi:MAG: M81 family metallopeptidase [Planctomycetes bacterium]|nr:M81 family metallopeptidase [Planctomycetota bacterium]
MRIAVAQLWQETNTFNRNPTTWDDFDRWGIARGDAVVEEYGATGELSGFLGACRDWRDDCEFVGLARFACWPWGRVDRGTWARIRQVFDEQLEAVGAVDAVFLALHGAMAAEDEHDLTGALLARVRKRVGPHIPVVGSLDLHANITKRMIAAADVLCGYHTCPHLDSVETGARAAAALRSMVDGAVRPVTQWRKLPMITAAESHNTFTGPPAPLYRRLQELEREPQVLSAGLYMAMPWFDAPELGWAVTLTTTGDAPGADAFGSSGAHDSGSVVSRWSREVNSLRGRCWAWRHAMEDVQRLSPREIVDRALAAERTPVVVGDGADATNSGAPGDSTHLLREFLSRPSIPNGALTFVVDPAAVARARAAGVGGGFDGPVGGTFAPEFSQPVHIRGTVERIGPIEFILHGHISRNLPVKMGIGAVVQSGDVTVLLVETTGPGSTPLLYEAAGVDPRRFRIVVAKSPAGFRADYEPFAGEILLADCPGCATPDWQRLDFQHIDRPLWPLDEIYIRFSGTVSKGGVR